MSEYWYNAGLEYFNSRRYEDAIDAYQIAIDAKEEPWTSLAEWRQSFPLLILGHYRKGFKRRESRFKVFNPYPLIQFLPTKKWEGEDIAGKTLLVHFDSGLGDTIQFLRYIPYLKKLPCRLVLFLQRELRCLFRHLEVPYYEELSIPPKCDYHVLVESLPYCLKTELSTIPPLTPISCQLKPEKGKIGLVWRSGMGPDQRKKSLELCQFEPFLNRDDLRFVSVQQELIEEDKVLLTKYGIEFPPIFSFIDTLKILETCERVICIDSAVGHLAASMGIPTWILVPHQGCWRWLVNRTDSPWYPSARLFHQKARGWEETIQEITKELCR